MKGEEDMDEMTTAELNEYIESIAEIVELKATTIAEAVDIIRSKKVKA